MGQQRRSNIVVCSRGLALDERRQAHDDPRGAEATLARTYFGEGCSPNRPQFGVKAIEGGDLAPGNPTCRSDTRNTGASVHPYRAATALALGTATVLRRFQI
jgi:hypothetical protein